MSSLSSVGWIYWRTGDGVDCFAPPDCRYVLALSPTEGHLRYRHEEHATAIGSLELRGAVFTALGATGGSEGQAGPVALQVALATGDVVHMEMESALLRDRWLFELNLAGLRAATSALPERRPPTAQTFTTVVGDERTPDWADGSYRAEQDQSESMTAKRPAARHEPGVSASASTGPIGPSDTAATDGTATTAAVVSTPNLDLHAVATFIDATFTFALSRMWADLLATFLFGLHPIPFCDSPELRATSVMCTPEAGSSWQFAYAFCLVPVAALAKHTSEQERFKHIPGVSSVGNVVGYMVGWAVADAAKQYLMEIAATHPSLCDHGSGCTGLNLGYTIAVSMVGAAVLILLQPFSLEVECGEGAPRCHLTPWIMGPSTVPLTVPSRPTQVWCGSSHAPQPFCLPPRASPLTSLGCEPPSGKAR